MRKINFDNFKKKFKMRNSLSKKTTIYKIFIKKFNIYIDLHFIKIT